MIDLKDMPGNYPLCTQSGCPRHETCLHWLAYDAKPVEKEIRIYDPRWQEQHGLADCEDYADSTPIVYAQGFEHIFDEMPKAKAESLRSRLLAHYGAYTYYRYRRGEYLMPPEVQDYIRKTAKNLGIETTITFRKEHQRICWGGHYIDTKQC